MATTVITFEYPDGAVELPANNKVTSIRNLSRYLYGLVGALKRGAHSVMFMANPTKATSTITFSTVSLGLATIVNGVSVGITAGGGDAASATSMANAINGNVSVNTIVTARAVGNTVIVESIRPGIVGNTITCSVTGIGMSATGGGRLTGGSNGTVFSYSF